MGFRELLVTRCSMLIAVVVSLSLALGAAHVAHAVDGVIEINQASVDAAGGFPLQITQPGSYRLTSNLTVPNADTTAINITADNVTLDLNGFSISGPGESGSGFGVSSGGSNITVRNGTVSGMGNIGVNFVGRGARVEWLHVSDNGSSGIRAVEGSTVRHNTASDNGFHGIFVQGSATNDLGSTVTHNTAYGNNFAGIVTIGDSTVQSNTAHGNGNVGISAGDGSTVTHNTARGNNSDGIVAGDGSTVQSNTGSGNSGAGIRAGAGSTVTHNTARGNGGAGIRADAANTVLSNTAVGNTGFGLELNGQLNTGYAHNVVENNTGGTVHGGTQIGTNLCDGNTTCP